MSSIEEQQNILARQLSEYHGTSNTIPVELATNPLLPQLDFEGKPVTGYRKIRKKESSEMVLTRALRLSNHLATGASPYVPAVPTQIVMPGGLVGGGDFTGGASPLDVAKHLSQDPSVNSKVLDTLYKGLRAEILRKTGKNVDNTFDQKMITNLNQIKSLESEVRENLVAMNQVQHFAPIVKGPAGSEWTQNEVQDRSKKLIERFYTSDGLLRNATIATTNLIAQVAGAVYSLPVVY